MSAATHSTSRIVWAALAFCLLLLRVPALVQPAGGDQGLYAYSEQRVNEGGVPYRFGSIAADGLAACTYLRARIDVLWFLGRIGALLAYLARYSGGKFDAVATDEMIRYVTERLGASAEFFLGNVELRAWLEAGYVPDRETAMFPVWRRRG